MEKNILEQAETGQSVAKDKFILKVISTYSPSGQENGVAELISGELRSRGLSSTIDSAGNVISEKGSGRSTVLLCGHMDTVPGEIPVKMDGDTICGRGACDAKGALLSLLFAYEDLANRDNPLMSGAKLIFAGVTQEELSSAGLTELINNNVKAEYAIFGEPGGLGKVTVGYRGHMTARLEIVTPEVHSSAPALGVNSAELLFELYNLVKNSLAADPRSTEAYSVSLTQVAGGSAHNVIPGRTSATLDVRIPIGRTVEETRQLVNRIVLQFAEIKPEAKISLSFDEPTEPYRVPLNSPIVRSINRAILRAGVKPSLITKSGTGDMNTYALAFGVDALTYGPGEAKLSHTPEERVSISEIFACSKIIADAVRDLFAMKMGSA
jgi:[amino group carrier protein]-lysine/ornithine hydrolase